MEEHELAGTCGLIGAFSYGGMPHEIAESNMRLFADKVLPRLKAIGVETIVGGDGETTMVAAK